MVELKVDNLGSGMVDRNDCFLSVRLGENQKMAHLSTSRIFRFPQAGDCRTGKIEVFRRLGGATIDVDPENQAARHISVACSDRPAHRVVPGSELSAAHLESVGNANVDLQIAVETPQAVNQAALKAEQKPDKSAELQDSKEYLQKHAVQARLKQAMQAVLRERPEDPAAFLAEKFLRYSPCYSSTDD